MKWYLGKYLQDELDKKGWKRSRLAEEAGLSTGYISWLLNGESPGKPNPPNLSVDTLLLLSGALNIHPAKLIVAYKGEDPERAFPDQTDEVLIAKFEDLIAQAKKLKGIE
jgi:transcriptional regulator with XRE-family HTH domain